MGRHQIETIVTRVRPLGRGSLRLLLPVSDRWADVGLRLLSPMSDRWAEVH
jgi:hypothetical protein